jgi:hypothetical protein
MSFTQNEMFLAMSELKNVWDYEKHEYNICLFNGRYIREDVLNTDKKEISYGINLGTLRKIFAEDALKAIL